MATVEGCLPATPTCIHPQSPGTQLPTKGGGIRGQNVTSNPSTVSGNYAGNDGGGIFGATVTLNSSTVSGNIAIDKGGGLWALGGSVNYSTIYGNTGVSYGGGIFVSGPRNFTIRASIVSGNLLQTSSFPSFGPNDLSGDPGSTFAASYSFVGTNLDGTLENMVLGTVNLVASPNNPDANGNLIGGQTPIVADLGPLRDNGGVTFTHAPKPGSRVVDAISLNITNTGMPPEIDQRNAPFNRVAGSGLDMGAVEIQSVAAGNFVVSTLEDTIDGDVSASDVSLREAISAANGSAGPDTITFDTAGLFDSAQTLLLDGVLNISDSITIEGPGASLLTIDAQGKSGIFNITPFDPLVTSENTIARLTLTNGLADNGGAISSSANLTINAAVITNNRTRTPPMGVGPAGHGGGVYGSVGTTITVNDSTISGNTAAGFGGGISGYYLRLNRSTINGNSAYLGGGTNSYFSTYLTDSTVSNNSASYRGGGVAIYALGRITNSTISGNEAGDLGGGVFVYNDRLTLAYSTVTGNTTGLRNGGGGIAINDGNGLANGDAITGSIVAGNSYPYGLSLPAGPALIFLADDLLGGNLTASYSLIGTNTNSNLAASPAGTMPDANGNLIGGAPATPMNPLDATINPFLGPLQDNGGTTHTHALMASSPAIDAGNPLAQSGMNGVPGTDQRGHPFVRVADGGSGMARVDMGAVERQTLAGFSFVVNTTVDEFDADLFSGATLSLREAIRVANLSAGADTITFDSTVFASARVINLMMGEIQITESIVINGPVARATIDAGGKSRHFYVADGDNHVLQQATLSGLTLTGGNASYGGSIYSTENLIINGSTLMGNTAANISGGAVYATSVYAYDSQAMGPATLPTVTVTGSVLSGNSDAEHGGAIAAYNIIATDSTISGNSAARQGGGLRAYGSATIQSSTISGNSAGEDGGGIFSRYPSTLTNSTISGNSAADQGGGLFVENSQTMGSTINSSTIAYNHAANAGGGIYLNIFDPTGAAIPGTATLNNSIVAKNSSVTSTSVDVSGVLSGTHSLVQDPTGATINGTHFVTGMDPLLGDLMENGGPTLTHLLLPGSPAIDAGDPSLIAGMGTVPPFDQRGTGFGRVQGDAIDMGALETSAIDVSGWHNAANPVDVNGDGLMFPIPLDALLVINELTDRVFSSRETGRFNVMHLPGNPFLDVDNDGSVAPLDALLVINQLPSTSARAPMGIRVESEDKQPRRRSEGSHERPHVDMDLSSHLSQWGCSISVFNISVLDESGTNWSKAERSPSEADRAPPWVTKGR